MLNRKGAKKLRLIKGNKVHKAKSSELLIVRNSFIKQQKQSIYYSSFTLSIQSISLNPRSKQSPLIFILILFKRCYPQFKQVAESIYFLPDNEAVFGFH